jgi:uncharacterized protein (DUF342 family)
MNLNYILMKLLKKIADFFRGAFSDFTDLLEEKAGTAVQITQAVKEAIEKHDGSIQWVLEHLKINGMNEAYAIAKEKLPAIVKELALIDSLVAPGQSQEQAWTAYTVYISGKVKNARRKEWVMLSAEILGAVIGKKVNLAFLIMATQRAYQLIFNKKALN